MICVPLIERTHQAKTRLLALHECCACVEKIGLSGLGKKGLLVVAKTLSEEALPENRAAALDLMEAVLSKMDGDVEKLINICGTNYLSDKAKALIEERWKKHSDIHPSSSLHFSKRDDKGRRRSQIPAMRTVKVDAPELSKRSPSPITIKADHSSAGDEVLRDELPSLKLRFDEGGSTFSMKPTESSALLMGPFAFSFEPPQQSSRQFESVEIFVEATKGASYTNKLPLASIDELPSNEKAPLSQTDGTDGAAASLRARLLRIREKQREVRVESKPAVSMSSFQPSLSPPDSPLTEPTVALQTRPEGAQSGDSYVVSDIPYSVLRASLEELLHTKIPVPEADPRLVSCTGALKKYHAAISSQPTAATDLSHTDFVALKQSISDNIVETVEDLTR